MMAMTSVCGSQTSRVQTRLSSSGRKAMAVSRPSKQTSRICAQSSAEGESTSRRNALMLGGTALLGATLAGPAQAKGGFEVVKDQQDAYQFVYPFGWQEVSIPGQDVVYKDVIEPLESVSVSYHPRDIQHGKTSVPFGEQLEQHISMVSISPQRDLSYNGYVSN